MPDAPTLVTESRPSRLCPGSDASSCNETDGSQFRFLVTACRDGPTLERGGTDDAGVPGGSSDSAKDPNRRETSCGGPASASVPRGQAVIAEARNPMRKGRSEGSSKADGQRDADRGNGSPLPPLHQQTRVVSVITQAKWKSPGYNCFKCSQAFLNSAGRTPNFCLLPLFVSRMSSDKISGAPFFALHWIAFNCVTS